MDSNTSLVFFSRFLVIVIGVVIFVIIFISINKTDTQMYESVTKYSIQQVERATIQVTTFSPFLLFSTSRLEAGYKVTLSDGSMYKVLENNYGYVPKVGEKLEPNRVYNRVYK